MAMQTASTVGSSGWARAGVVRRAHPASGAQWNVQVVRGKVNGRCLWNACKALSLGLMLMLLGAAMATIGYYADHLSMRQEVRGNHTVRIKNESRGFHLNNLSYAGPIVMGVGGFIVVAACVMTFEARDSAAKVVPARPKVGGPNSSPGVPHSRGHSYRTDPGSGSVYRAASSQTAGQSSAVPGVVPNPAGIVPQHSRRSIRPQYDRAAFTHALVQFSRGLASLEAKRRSVCSTGSGQGGGNQQLHRSPSAPDLAMCRGLSYSGSNSPQSPRVPGFLPATTGVMQAGAPIIKANRSPRQTFAACALLNPGLLQRFALSVDETQSTSYGKHSHPKHHHHHHRHHQDPLHHHHRYQCSSESLGGTATGGGSHEGSLAMDLHLPNDCPVTLRVRDRTRGGSRRPALQRQRHVISDEDASMAAAAAAVDQWSRRGSHSPRAAQRVNAQWQLPCASGGSRRSSNASDCTHGASARRARRHHHHHTQGRHGAVPGRLERAVSSDSRLTGGGQAQHKPLGPTGSGPGATGHPYHRSPCCLTPNTSPQSTSFAEDDSENGDGPQDNQNEDVSA